MFSLTAQKAHRVWSCFLLVALCASPLSVSAKPERLKEVTDGNWEEILSGEWMIELSVLLASTANGSAASCLSETGTPFVVFISHKPVRSTSSSYQRCLHLVDAFGVLYSNQLSSRGRMLASLLQVRS